jgi:hypothetical protein
VLHVGNGIEMICLQKHASRSGNVRGVLRELSYRHTVVFNFGKERAVMELKMLRVGHVEQAADGKFAGTYAAKQRDVG